jgi:glucose-6-phosphate 1-dehydrogenase
MEPPATSHVKAHLEAKAKVLESMKPLRPADVVRGQVAGYHKIHGVAAGSTTETFAAMRVYIDNWRWAGVPFAIRTGKNLPLSATEVVVNFKRPPQDIFGEGHSTPANFLRFRLSPDVSISLGVRTKQSGDKMVGIQQELTVHEQTAGDMTPYERLLKDAIHGDNTLFAREDTIEAAWRVIDPVIGDVTPLHTYKPGSWGPAQAAEVTKHLGGWHNPS